MIRVLHVIAYPLDTPNGIAQMVAQLTYWQSQYCQVGIAVLSSHAWLDGVPHREDPRTFYSAGRARIFGFALPSRLMAVIREFGPDIIHIHQPFRPENLVLAHLVDRPLVLSPHGGYLPHVLSRNRVSKTKKWMYLPLERRLLSRVAGVHALVPEEALSVERLLKKGATLPIKVIPNGIDPSRFRRSVPAKQRTTEPYYLFLGRLDVEHKGLDLLLAGYARALSTHGSLPKLLIVGPDERGGRAWLARTIKNFGLIHNVEIGDAVTGEAKWNLIMNAIAYVQVSRFEGMSISILEAMSAGVPLLVSVTAGVANYIQNYGNGVVVPLEGKAIADGLIEVLHPRYESRAKGAIKSLEQVLSWRSIALEHTRFYRTVLSGGAGLEQTTWAPSL